MTSSLLRHLKRHTAVLAAGLGLAALAQAGPYTSLTVFGDSLSDNGNDLLVTGGAVPAPSVYTDGTNVGRFSNGLSYADFLAGGLGLALTPSQSGGSNYAFGGARVSSVAAGLPPTALSFNQQLAAFDGTHAQADAGGLYVLWIGANDMADAIKLRAGGDLTALPSAMANAMQGIGGAITDLSSRGATHFLIPNLPDLSLTPGIRAFNSPVLSFLAHQASLSFNQALDNTLGLPAFASLDIHPFDAFGAQTEITANPGAFGFTNVTSACFTGDVNGQALPGGPAPSVCSTPSSYMYWDYEHPTTALHSVLGSRALAAAVPEPSQGLLLMLGLTAVAGLHRARRRA